MCNAPATFQRLIDDVLVSPLIVRVISPISRRILIDFARRAEVEDKEM